MVDQRPEVFGVEEVDAVQVGDVDSPGVGSCTVRAILLDMEAEETDFTAINLFKDKQSLCSVGKLLREVTLWPERERGNEGRRVSWVGPHLEPVLHERSGVQHLVEGGHGTNDDLHSRVRVAEEHVDPVLQERRQLVGWQTCRQQKETSLLLLLPHYNTIELGEH